MWSEVQQSGGIFTGVQFGPSAFWGLPEVRCPGSLREPVELYVKELSASSKPQEETLDKSARRLLLAIVAQALREARRNGRDRTTQLVKQDAICFLRSGYALKMLQASGSTRLNQNDINQYCATCEAEMPRPAVIKQ